MILLTGGSGLLGRHLIPLLDCFAPSRKYFDVERPSKLPEDVSLVVHAAAYTDVARAEVEREDCYGTNVMGTLNMALLGLPLVYISTAYVFDGMRGDYCEEDAPNPINAYARSKLDGERFAKRAPRWLIIRTLFKPRPFEHPNACTDQYSNGDYVDVIAPLIARAVKLFEEEKVSNRIFHIGTEKRSMYDLAKQSRDVQKITRKEICTPLPRDVSLRLSSI